MLKTFGSRLSENEKWARAAACYLMSDEERKDFLGFVSHLLRCAWRVKEEEAGRCPDCVVIRRCRLTHAFTEKRTPLFAPPRGIPASRETKSDLGHQTWFCFFFFHLTYMHTSFLFGSRAPKNCELCPTTLFALLYIHMFSSNKHPTVFLVFAGHKLLSANPIKHQHQPWTDSEIQPLNCHLSGQTTKGVDAIMLHVTPLSLRVNVNMHISYTHKNPRCWIIYPNIKKRECTLWMQADSFTE